MKEVIKPVLLLLCIALLALLFYKIKHVNIAPKFTFDKSGNYTGFSDLPSNYTVEDAKDDGYFVTKDLKIIANRDVWDNFVKTSSRKENRSIRIVMFSSDSKNGPFFKDLFYKNGKYYMFDSSVKDEKKQPFLYLLTLIEDYEEPSKALGIIVLADDNTLTYEKVDKAMLSSNSELIRSISPFKLVMFKMR